eukprot:TRINITY_DN1498_c0_g1_i1.p1 TRINITY_DN1498_c0_g1~~TRINITY_DN1498_c0_g1_i1.p1  ORF type:complete len:250 (-),score=36.56 TRINITY_DN1498_c0_g1_i1:157-906(-)
MTVLSRVFDFAVIQTLLNLPWWHSNMGKQMLPSMLSVPALSVFPYLGRLLVMPGYITRVILEKFNLLGEPDNVNMQKASLEELSHHTSISVAFLLLLLSSYMILLGLSKLYMLVAGLGFIILAAILSLNNVNIEFWGYIAICAFVIYFIRESSLAFNAPLTTPTTPSRTPPKKPTKSATSPRSPISPRPQRDYSGGKVYNSGRISLEEYERQGQRFTDQELKKLQQSREYQDFMAKRNQQYEDEEEDEE